MSRTSHRGVRFLITRVGQLLMRDITTSQRTSLHSNPSPKSEGISHAPSHLLFRKKSRSYRLSPCKRGLLTPIYSLPTFCGFASRRYFSVMYNKKQSLHTCRALPIEVCDFLLPAPGGCLYGILPRRSGLLHRTRGSVYLRFSTRTASPGSSALHSRPAGPERPDMRRTSPHLGLAAGRGEFTKSPAQLKSFDRWTKCFSADTI